MVEGTLASGESVAIMARRYGVNANQLFHWRKLYQAGLLARNGSMRSGEKRSAAVADFGILVWPSSGS